VGGAGAGGAALATPKKLLMPLNAADTAPSGEASIGGWVDSKIGNSCTPTRLAYMNARGRAQVGRNLIELGSR
jgi:hypothetical protein